MSEQTVPQGLRATLQKPYPVLWLLFLIYMCNAMDRNIIAFLAEPIRRDLDITDTQLGLLTGLAFAFFYTLCGVPVGWLADRIGRVLTISVACVVWSACSMAGALSSTFGHLALARVGVAIGEAGGTAPSYALIAAKFAPEQRGHALGLFHIGAPLASLIGVALSGWFAAHYGWRTALVAVSLPGLVFAAVLFLFVREPARGADEAGGANAVPAPPLTRSFVDFWRHPVLGLCFIFAGITSFATHALIAWAPAFLMRVKGMTLIEMSVWFSVCNASALALGFWLGGALSDRLARRTPGAYALVPAAGLLIAIPFLVMAVFADGWMASMFLLTVPICFAGLFLAPAVAVVQAYAPAHQATVFGSIYLLANNLVGSGLGPLYVGTISDYFKASQGTAALGFGLMALVPVMALAVFGQILIARAIGRHPEAFRRSA